MTLFIAYLLNIIDYLFTSYWVNLYGISIEGNPLGRWLFENDLAGIVKIFIVGGAFLLLGVFFKKYPKYKPVAVIPLVVYGFVVMYHIYLFLIPIL